MHQGGALTLLLGNLRVLVRVADDGRRKVGAVLVVRVCVGTAADVDRCVPGDRIIDDSTQAFEVRAVDHRTDVDSREVALGALCHDGADAEARSPLGKHSVQLVVLVRVHEHALDPDAVLARVLEDAAHEHGRPLAQVRSRQENRRVLATKLQVTRCQVFRCIPGDLYTI
jgi:hypothetical protein